MAGMLAMGRLVQAISECHYDIGDEHIEQFVSKVNFDPFDELADENKRDFANARADAKDLTEEEEVHDCNSCGHDDTAAMIKNRVVCQYCKADEQIIDCCVFGSPSLQSKAIVRDDDYEGRTDYACEPGDDRSRAMGRD